MVTPVELKRLLLLVKPGRYSNIEGLDSLRDLLRDDATGNVLRFLHKELKRTEGQIRGGLAFVLAEHYCETGDLPRLQDLFRTDDPVVKEFVLNGLWGKPGREVDTAKGIVAMAIEATQHPNVSVRTQACFVLQNQCGWNVDVHAAIEPLVGLLSDPEAPARRQAAYALGNFAKHRCNVASAIPRLQTNLKDTASQTRQASAWALWQLSRNCHDITAAIPELVSLMAIADENNEPRKQAAGALLHHARKSPASLAVVRTCVESRPLDQKQKDIVKFCRTLSEM